MKFLHFSRPRKDKKKIAILFFSRRPAHDKSNVKIYFQIDYESTDYNAFSTLFAVDKNNIITFITTRPFIPSTQSFRYFF